MTAEVLAAGRAAAESLMTDTCRIIRAGASSGPLNPATGQYDSPDPADVVYEGPCRLNVPSQIANSSTSAAAEASWKVQDSVLSLPVAGSEAVAPNQTVEYLTAAHDASLPGRKFGVIGAHSESQATARRLMVREVTG